MASSKHVGSCTYKANEQDSYTSLKDLNFQGGILELEDELLDGDPQPVSEFLDGDDLLLLFGDDEVLLLFGDDGVLLTLEGLLFVYISVSFRDSKIKKVCTCAIFPGPANCFTEYQIPTHNHLATYRVI